MSLIRSLAWALLPQVVRWEAGKRLHGRSLTSRLCPPDKDLLQGERESLALACDIVIWLFSRVMEGGPCL